MSWLYCYKAWLSVMVGFDLIWLFWGPPFQLKQIQSWIFVMESTEWDLVGHRLITQQSFYKDKIIFIFHKETKLFLSFFSFLDINAWPIRIYFKKVGGLSWYNPKFIVVIGLNYDTHFVYKQFLNSAWHQATVEQCKLYIFFIAYLEFNLLTEAMLAKSQIPVMPREANALWTKQM